MLIFRPARAADVDAAVGLIHASGPADFDYVLPDAQGFLRYAFVQGTGRLGFRRHSVGERDGRVVAVGVGWSGRENGAIALAAGWQFVRFYGPVAAIGVIWRGLRAERVMRPPGRDAFYIGHLAVAEDARGQGIGAELVAHMLRRAGACRAVLDVATGNARAAALYARCGFAVTATRRGGARTGRGQISDHYRMERGQTGPAQYSAV